MIVGLPGAGLSTVFYIICALLMPFHTAFVILSGRTRRAGQGRLLVRQVGIALGIVAMWVVIALVISLVLALTQGDGGAGDTTAQDIIPFWSVIARLGPLFAVVTLVVVIAIIRVLSIFVGPPRMGSGAQGQLNSRGEPPT